MTARLTRRTSATWRTLLTAIVLSLLVPILSAAGHPPGAEPAHRLPRSPVGVVTSSHGPYFSYYVYSEPSKAPLATISSLGGKQANSDCSLHISPNESDAFLDFGVQNNAGTGAWSTIGPEGAPSTPFYKNSWIRTAADAFAEGYSEVASRCASSSNQTNLLIGTNNSWPSLPTSPQARVMADAWEAITVGVYKDYVAWGKTHPQEYGFVLPGPGIDSEPGFNGPVETLVWTNRLAADLDKLPLLEFAHLAPIEDYGSADGCPAGGNYTNGTQCSNGWTGASFNQLLIDTLGAPEIYENTSNPTQAQQWTWLCVFWVKQNPSKPAFSPFELGTILVDPPAFGLSDANAWNIFISDLNTSGNEVCKDNPPAYETEISRHV
jgi:hypothetical protein